MFYRGVCTYKSAGFALEIYVYGQLSLENETKMARLKG